MRKLAFAIKNSSTVILPQWNALLIRLELAQSMMPHDVRTRWNSTFEMLKFTVQYRAAIDKISAGKDLRAYEMDEEEWEIVTQLCAVLKVCLLRYVPARNLFTVQYEDFQGRNTFLFEEQRPEHCSCNSCHGPP